MDARGGNETLGCVVVTWDKDVHFSSNTEPEIKSMKALHEAFAAATMSVIVAAILLTAILGMMA